MSKYEKVLDFLTSADEINLLVLSFHSLQPVGELLMAKPLP